MSFSEMTRGLRVKLIFSAATVLLASPAIAGTYAGIDNGYGLPPNDRSSLYDFANSDVVFGDSGSREVGYCVAGSGCADVVWKPVTGDVWASASLANAELKTRAYLSFGENKPGSAVAQLGSNFETASATASFDDTFYITSASGSPFLWNAGSNVGFNFDVSGAAEWSENLVADPASLTNIYSRLDFLAYDPVSYEVITGKSWLLGDYATNSAFWSALNDPLLTPAVWDGLEVVDLLSSSTINYTFNPGQDFFWTLRLTNWVALDVTEENVFASLDFSHTVKTSYQGPEGSVTRSASALFPFTTPVSAVPEPATWAMMITGFGLAGAGLRRSRRALAAA
ncbi:PEPxxWA-CTERM sorting domain-containing protein [Phenylobacterium sp.]|uniref:PEPxxWA-CTERM sorting domain-containing protein n=1 Tax=Phenylobacterium sp. TaxID=1871053 RepID=UPI0028992D01|nr:PEPxxWA-CTERM sorting domain-containing protein [Phenylobacterium sp.]